jgi:hypothetical protein
MFVSCVSYSKGKRHSQDNQDKEAVHMKYRGKKKSWRGVWLSVYGECRIFSGGELCGGPIPRPEEPYRVLCVMQKPQE